MAIRAEKPLTCQAETTPIKSNKKAIIPALLTDARPLGMGRSGLSTLSNSASKTSLKATPPPYKPMVASTNQPMDFKIVTSISCSRR